MKKKRLLKRPVLDKTNREELQKNDKAHLTRSGRSMRILNPNQDSNTKKKIWDTKDLSNSRSFSVLEKQQIIAEITYVLQPLLHLSSIGFFGFNSWVPWMVSFSCDVIRYVSQGYTDSTYETQRTMNWQKSFHFSVYFSVTRSIGLTSKT